MLQRSNTCGAEFKSLKPEQGPCAPHLLLMTQFPADDFDFTAPVLRQTNSMFEQNLETT